MRKSFNTVADVMTSNEHKMLAAQFLAHAGETRRAAMRAAKGEDVGFWDAQGHKNNARGLIQAAKARRLIVEARKRNPFVFTVVAGR